MLPKALCDDDDVKRGKVSDEERAEILRLCDEGVAQCDIAKQLNRWPSTIRNVIVKTGRKAVYSPIARNKQGLKPAMPERSVERRVTREPRKLTAEERVKHHINYAAWAASLRW